MIQGAERLTIACVDWYEMVIEHRENPHFDIQRLIDAGDKLAAAAVADGFVCKVRAAGVTDPPPECDWPCCDCDPYAQKVFDAMGKAGLKIIDDGTGA